MGLRRLGFIVRRKSLEVGERTWEDLYDMIRTVPFAAKVAKTGVRDGWMFDESNKTRITTLQLGRVFVERWFGWNEEMAENKVVIAWIRVVCRLGV